LPKDPFCSDQSASSAFHSAGLITHRFPLDAWKEAIATSLDKKSGAIKVILDYR
jgi:threonine dehydrogenase-like Zn-dependent dehydrogenase